MKIKFQDLVIEFPLELQAVLDLGLKCGYSEHPSFWFEAVVPEEKAKSYIGKITEDTKVKVTYENKKKKAQRVLFSGYTSDAKLQYTNGYYILRVKALCHTAKLDIEKKSRSFFKKNITYKEIVEAIAKDYPGAVVKQNIKSDRKTDIPILQYEETDWQFLKRMASMFEAVVTPDCTKDIAFLTLGIPERETKAKNIAKEEQTSIRDLKGCYEDFYEEQSAFSVLKLMKQEKEQKKKEAEKKKVKKELQEKLGSTETVAQMGMGSTVDFLELEQKQEKEDIQKQTLQNIETMIDAGLLDVSKLHYDKKDLKNLIMDAMDTLEEEEAKATGKAKKQLNVDTEKGKQAAESNMQELNHTTIVVRSTKYVPMGKRILIDDSELAVTHVEAFVENEIVYYEHILRWPDAITARYHDNPLLAGVCLIGTVKQRIGNTISIKLEIDEDDGYDNGGEDYFFTYAIESKDYYCMPVEGAKVHLYFQTGKEWDAIAVHSLRGLEAGGQREHKISNPDNRSLSNPDGCSIDLTPGGISMTPDDGSKVELKLGKDGTMSMRADNVTITGKNIELGKATTADGEEVICESLCVSAGEHLFINRCQGSEGGEVVPIEDHLAAVFGTTQIYATGLVYHLTDGEFRAPSISYDETELRKKGKKQTRTIEK